MKKGTIISIIIALIALAGALLGLVAYMRSRRCLACDSTDEDYIPDSEADYDMEYYVDDATSSMSEDDCDEGSSNYISAPVLSEDIDGEEDITE